MDCEKVVVTGTSGFIGQHLLASLESNQTATVAVDRLAPPPQQRSPHLKIELSDYAQVRSGFEPLQRAKLIHLAAEAEVVTPWEQVPATFSTNLTATWNVLTALQTRLIVFPSTCSVYGTALHSQSLPRPSSVKPLSLYGASKSMGEVMLRDWAEEFAATAVILRLGNVIGPGCRGLIAYLARHAVRYPDGQVEAQLRGHGKLVRDYTPVEYVVHAFQLALHGNWKPGTTPIFNVGTGRGMDNRELTGIVERVLRKKGYRLRYQFDNPVPSGEAIRIVLNCDSFEKQFGVQPPSSEQVEYSIEQSVLSHLPA